MLSFKARHCLVVSQRSQGQLFRLVSSSTWGPVPPLSSALTANVCGLGACHGSQSLPNRFSLVRVIISNTELARL